MVLDKDPKNVQAALLLGNALAGLKDFEGAVKELEEAAKLDPTSSAAYTSLGMVRLMQAASLKQRLRSGTRWRRRPNQAMTHIALAQYLMGHRSGTRKLKPSF